jgi:hypothetical protein
MQEIWWYLYAIVNTSMLLDDIILMKSLLLRKLKEWNREGMDE